MLSSRLSILFSLFPLLCFLYFSYFLFLFAAFRLCFVQEIPGMRLGVSKGHPERGLNVGGYEEVGRGARMGQPG